MDIVGVSECGGALVEALNTRVYGNGTQTLVLSHGFGTDQTVWHYLLPFLAYYFKVVVFDLVFSPNVDPKLYDPVKYSTFDAYAQDLICILDHLGVKKSIYMGHSMSAMIGCKAAITRPELFQHLVLLSGSPRYLNARGYNGGFSRPVLDSIFKDMHQNYSAWVRAFAPKAVGCVKKRTAVAEFESSLRKMEPEIALSVAKNVFLSDLRQVLQHVQVPSTIVQSKEDIVVPESVAFYMKKKLGGHAKVKILRTRGHLPQLTDYPLLSRILKRVLHDIK